MTAICAFRRPVRSHPRPPVRLNIGRSWKSFAIFVKRRCQSRLRHRRLCHLDCLGLTGPYSAFRQVSKAANAARANSGQFTPRQLGAAARETGPIADLAQAAQGTVGQPMSSYPWIGKAAALGLGWHNPAAVVGSIGGANLLATQTVQRAMMGDTVAQKAIQTLIAAHPGMVGMVQMIMRNAATTGVGNSI